jgi:hypothetical protein
MSKLVFTAAAALMCMTSISVGATYEVDRWPGDVDNIPCSAWHKSADGTWVLDGTIKLGSSDLENVGVKGDAAAHKIDKKCGK